MSCASCKWEEYLLGVNQIKGGELVHTLSVQCENVVRLGVQAGLKIETKFTNRLANPSLIGL